ncbi:DUF3307 domain-containing protein [Reichenbachiella versicolor]|uniref:DUF3307 domain-containing protein n=1 Tax=Reichenbachiella versicolor TaxID=1821036 RepID=UPI000D6E30AB|nr:DUF3307 domain-containing protein [Reichenbachiella versicolor]
MTFSIILLAHWMGDFGFQTSKMALRKSKSKKWLLYHVSTYTGVIAVTSLILFPPEDAFYYILTNGFLHLATDFVTSKLASRYRDSPRMYYPIIGFDQMIHTLSLYWTLQLM